MVKGDGKYLSVDYEKVVDVFLTIYQTTVVTREVLRSILFDDDYSPSAGVVNDLGGRTPQTTAAEVRLAMLQFPLKQVGNEQGDLGVLASLYNGGDNMLKLSDVSETDEVKNLKIVAVERDATIAEQADTIAERDATIAEQEATIAEINAKLQPWPLIEQTMPLSTGALFGTGSGRKGQSFTVPTNTGLSTGTYKLKILTTCIGGRDQQQNTRGIQETRLKLRDFVNNDETSSSTNCFSGTLLATSGYGSVTGLAPDSFLLESTFVFDELVPLTVGNKYVIEMELSRVNAYVKIPGPYNNGQAYDINGINLSLVRDSPFRIEGIKF
jgi:hypothetical protein